MCIYLCILISNVWQPKSLCITLVVWGNHPLLVYYGRMNFSVMCASVSMCDQTNDFKRLIQLL